MRVIFMGTPDFAVPPLVALVEAGHSWSYRELSTAYLQVAAILQEQGVRAGDRVLVIGENCAALVALLFALSSLDAWAVMVNARLSAREIDSVREHCGARRTIYLETGSPEAAAHAAKAQASLERFWLEAAGWCADVLEAPAGIPAAEAAPDTRLRPNQLLAITLGLVSGVRARRMVDAASRHLLVPGALRSLAPLPVEPLRPLQTADGKSLNDPLHPYWGHYQGDEDTQRKPAYHNGTAWVWWLPLYCEALAVAWDFDPLAVAAARAQMGGLERLLGEGCLGQLPEILDGDAPHRWRGCDAQAWSASEALRVWVRLEQPPA